MHDTERWYARLLSISATLLLLLGVPYLFWAAAGLAMGLYFSGHAIDTWGVELIKAFAIIGLSAALAMLRDMDARLARIEQRLQQADSKPAGPQADPQSHSSSL